MGRKGCRPGAIDTAPTFPEPKQPHDNSRHRELCRLAGKWLRKPKFGSSYCPYVAVELVTANPETPDVFGWNYWATVLIEVKVSRSDFLADAKKSFRQQPEEDLIALPHRQRRDSRLVDPAQHALVARTQRAGEAVGREKGTCTLPPTCRTKTSPRRGSASRSASDRSPPYASRRRHSSASHCPRISRRCRPICRD